MRLSGPCRQALVSGPEPLALKGAPLQVPGINAEGGHESLGLASLILQVDTSTCNSVFLDLVNYLH